MVLVMQLPAATRDCIGLPPNFVESPFKIFYSVAHAQYMERASPNSGDLASRDPGSWSGAEATEGTPIC